MRAWMRFGSSFAAVCLLLIAAGLVVSCSKGSPLVVGEGQESVPSESFADWKGYGDAIVVFWVISEAAEPESEAVRSTGEGLINRSIGIAVTETLWTRPSAPELPAAPVLSAWGWGLHDGTRTPTVARGDARLEVGHSYLGVLAQFAGGGWSTLGTHAVIPADEGRLGHGEWRGRGDRALTGALAQLDGHDVRRARTLIAGAVADPLAVKHADLDPAARYQQVLADRRG